MIIIEKTLNNYLLKGLKDQVKKSRNVKINSSLLFFFQLCSNNYCNEHLRSVPFTLIIKSLEDNEHFVIFNISLKKKNSKKY